ncbi:hypothetical protein BGZ93_009896 [Podila epicladia]|nr:hypothetical protein BGZ92_002103 [Podila epicladia]KAG0098923.1 hypothetical protein BGZ93_009896 [Podila epicladia]
MKLSASFSSIFVLVTLTYTVSAAGKISCKDVCTSSGDSEGYCNELCKEVGPIEPTCFRNCLKDGSIWFACATKLYRVRREVVQCSILRRKHLGGAYQEKTQEHLGYDYCNRTCRDQSATAIASGVAEATQIALTNAPTKLQELFVQESYIEQTDPQSFGNHQTTLSPSCRTLFT